MTEQKRKLSKIAVWSLVFALISLLCLVFFVFIPWINIFSVWLFPVSLFLSIVLGIIAVFQIIKKRKILKGIPFATGGLSISVLLVGVIGIVVYSVILVFDSHGCFENLKGIGVTLRIYSQDFDNEYPTSNKWCDLLIEYADVRERAFVRLRRNLEAKKNLTMR